MKILVTGSTGFVGSHLCESLLKDGHQVFALTRSLKKFKELKIPAFPIHGSLSFQRPNEWIKNLPQDLDAVVHTAGLVHSYQDKDFYNINSKATQRLINDLVDRFKERSLKFVHLSSLAAAGPATKNQVLTEAHPPAPISTYGKSKLESEILLNKLAPNSWDVVILRPPMVIGPRDSAVLDIFKMVKGRNILLVGTQGKNKRYSFICVHDLVAVIKKSLEAKISRNNNVFYPAHQQIITLEELVEEISSQLKTKRLRYIALPKALIKGLTYITSMAYKVKNHDIRLTPDKFHELAADAWICSGNKIAVEMNYHYQWSIDETIKETLADYQKRNWI